LRILFLNVAYPPFPGGGERYVRALAAGLAARGHVVTAVCGAAQLERELWQGAAAGDEALVDGVRLIRLPIRPFPGGFTGVKAWRKMMVLLSALPGDQTAVLQHMARQMPRLSGLEATLQTVNPASFDLIHTFNLSWEYPMVAGLRAAQRHGVPYVATPFAHTSVGHDRVTRNSNMDHQLHFLRQADRVLVLTAVEAAALADWGIPEERLAVIGGGLDDLPDTAVSLDHYQLPSPFALFVGRHSRDKGALDAARAILRLRAAGSPVTLALAGQSTAEFDRFYEQLNEQEQMGIRPLGVVDEATKHSLLAQAALLLLPSRTDSFGIVLLEAWAHGTPVVAARAGGIPGVVDDGENGLLTPYGDVDQLVQAVAHLLDNGDEARRLGANGWQKVAAVYTWPAVTDRVLAHYAAVQTKEWK
jgi:glycosyltransferase involved in cell wall biosynthesis